MAKDLTFEKISAFYKENFELYWDWAIEDATILVLAVITIGFIIKKEKRAFVTIIEMICWAFLYSGIYENEATLMQWYKYGKNFLMYGNVPIMVMLVQYLTAYPAIRLCRIMKLPSWMIPIFVGGFTIIYDTSLDPLSFCQLHETKSGLVGRWSWLLKEGEANILHIPPYNYGGWFIIMLYGCSFFMLGRHLYEKSIAKQEEANKLRGPKEQKPISHIVGYIYPPVASTLGWIVMLGPQSAFILWLFPFSDKGGITEFIMLGVDMTLFLGVILYWVFKGMPLERNADGSKIGYADEYPLALVYGVNHVSNIFFALIQGHWHLFVLQIPFAVLQCGFIAWVLWPESNSSSSEKKE